MWSKLCNFLHDIAGVPSYKRYLEHLAQHYPEQEPLSEKEFHRQATDEKYDGGSIRRCC
ncbi:YbdD/YjiX family protein [Thermoactinomyces sp. DSM 45892]|uniref:YbdD/YjiX family protein n=1 Tax=Thermoactinomyces sp. DSM 45892 TaxID=1882753 RepID=UPI0008991D9C|nr:YbdD/YjiX family protein [Thermoactinomyces sp. DSM 45892]SDY15423.1 Uncharacterized short protein YbdD, DUF466 family [Thermoactinomyces sp. DSM 45892]